MKTFVNVYEIDRCYGGPEEGGWWFDTGTPVACHRIRRPIGRRKAAQKLRDSLREQYQQTGRRYSVLGGEDYEVYIEKEPAKAFPDTYPYYE